MRFETLTSVGRRLNWCGRQYHVMRYGECYVALRSQRTNHVLHYEYTSTGENLPFLEEWENFAKVIKRAMIACENSGHSIPDDFPEVRKIVEAGVTTKPKKDYELSRYACYLIVQNGDPRKEVIALGQTYFAIQTYRQEVADHFNELDEDNRRLVVRGDIKQWNQMLAETAHNAGVITNEEFAIFQNAGYMGLYGGLDVDDIHTKKQLEVGQKILDYMGSTELIANGILGVTRDRVRLIDGSYNKRVLIVTIITNIIDAALTINSIETVVKAVKYSQQ